MIKGSKMSEESRKNVSLGHKGQKAWNKGRKMSIEEKSKMNMSGLKLGIGFYTGKKRPEITGKNHPAWKEKLTYSGIHQWMKNNYGKALVCQNSECYYPRKNRSGITILRPKIYHWANISGEYKKDIKDWIQLCPSCHRKWDLNIIEIDLSTCVQSTNKLH